MLSTREPASLVFFFKDEKSSLRLGQRYETEAVQFLKEKAIPYGIAFSFTSVPQIGTHIELISPPKLTTTASNHATSGWIGTLVFVGECSGGLSETRRGVVEKFENSGLLPSDLSSAVALKREQVRWCGVSENEIMTLLVSFAKSRIEGFAPYQARTVLAFDPLLVQSANIAESEFLSLALNSWMESEISGTVLHDMTTTEFYAHIRRRGIPTPYTGGVVGEAVCTFNIPWSSEPTLVALLKELSNTKTKQVETQQV